MAVFKCDCVNKEAKEKKTYKKYGINTTNQQIHCKCMIFIYVQIFGIILALFLYIFHKWIFERKSVKRDSTNFSNEIVFTMQLL